MGIDRLREKGSACGRVAFLRRLGPLGKSGVWKRRGEGPFFPPVCDSDAFFEFHGYKAIPNACLGARLQPDDRVVLARRPFQNASRPVNALPSTSVCTSCVPSYVYTLSRFS